MKLTVQAKIAPPIGTAWWCKIIIKDAKLVMYTLIFFKKELKGIP